MGTGDSGWDDLEIDLEDEVLVSTSASVAEGEEEEEGSPHGGRAEKRIKQLVRQRNEEREARDALLREVENLKKKVGFLSKNQKEFETATVAGLKRDLEQEIEAAEQAWVEAVNEGDSTKAVELRKKARDLEGKLQKVNSYEPPADDEPEDKGQRGGPPANQKVVSWLQKNPQVLQDPVLKAATAEKARELEAAGWSPWDDEYYEEVEKHLASEFPNRFRGEGTRKAPPRSVGGKTRVAGGKRTVTLTKDEQAMAKKFGMTNEEYAKHKVQAEKAQEENGGYVNIFN